LRVQDLSALIHIDERTIRGWVKKDLIPSFKAPGSSVYLFDLNEVIRAIRSDAIETGQEEHASLRIAAQIAGCDAGKETLMGRVKKVKKGKGHSYYYDVQIRRKRYRGVIPEAQNKKQALEAFRQIMNDIYEGRYGGAYKDPIFSEFVAESYWEWARATKPRSLKMDKYRIKPILAFFGRKRISEISSFLIEKYKIVRRDTPIKKTRKMGGTTVTWEKPRSTTSVTREIFLLSSVLSLAVADKKIVINENPCRSVEIPKEQGRTRYLQPEEQESLFAVLVGPRAHLRQIVDLYLNTGTRENELLRLPTGLVDFHRNVIYVKNTKGDIDHEIPLNGQAREILQTLVNRARAKGYEYIFTNPVTKKPYTSLKTAWKTACMKAGITDLRIHDLRHTFGTRAADAGVPLPAIRDVMGHRSIRMTERYAHATDEGKRRVVEAAGRKIAQVVKIASKKAVGK